MFSRKKEYKPTVLKDLLVDLQKDNGLRDKISFVMERMDQGARSTDRYGSYADFIGGTLSYAASSLSFIDFRPGGIIKTRRY